MPVTVLICDETTSGGRSAQTPLELPAEVMSVRELIRERVYQEVQDFNQGTIERTFRGLVQPTEAEQVLNSRAPAEYRLARPRQIDWKAQFAAACEAFEANRFLLLVNNRQAESLDEQFTIGPGAEISFLKLTPLVGG